MDSNPRYGDGGGSGHASRLYLSPSRGQVLAEKRLRNWRAYDVEPSFLLPSDPPRSAARGPVAYVCPGVEPGRGQLAYNTQLSPINLLKVIEEEESDVLRGHRPRSERTAQ